MIPFLFSWANAPYMTALLVVAFYVLLQIVGLLPWGGDADTDVDHDAPGPDADHDVDAGADHDAGADGDHDADDSAKAGSFTWLGFLGVGRVPMTVVWQTLLTMFGLVGITATTVAVSMTGRLSALFLVGTFPAAVVVGTVLSVGTVRAIARVVPAASGQASSRRELVGCSGIVISSRVTGEFGEVRLRDPAGRTLRLVCYAGEGEPELAEGTEVVVSDWDEQKDRLYVTPTGKLLEGREQ